MAEEQPPAESAVTEVEITVAGHTIIVKAAAPLEEVSKTAISLYRKTKLAAEKIPFGFDISAAQVERADGLPDYTGPLEGWQEDDHAGLGRKHAEGNTPV